jgi:hypothetical protein
MCSDGPTGVSWDSTDDWRVQIWFLTEDQELDSTPDACAELLDHVQAVDMGTRAFKQV